MHDASHVTYDPSEPFDLNLFMRNENRNNRKYLLLLQSSEPEARRITESCVKDNAPQSAKTEYSLPPTPLLEIGGNLDPIPEGG